MSTHVQRPLVPEDLTRRRDSLGLSLARAFVVSANADRSIKAPVENIRALYGGDPAAVDIVTKSEVSAATLASTTEFSQTQIHTLGAILGTDSVLQMAVPDATVVTFDQNAAMFVSGLTRDGTAVVFSKAGDPFKVVQKDVSKGVTLYAGHRCGLIVTFTRELLESSSAAALVHRQIAADLGAGFDRIFLGTAAAIEGTTPAGLRSTVNAIAATAGNGEAAMTADLAAIGAAVARTGGGNVLYIASPKEYVKIRATLPTFKLPLAASSGLDDGIVCCLAPAALAISASDRPLRVEVSDQTVLHMSDSPTALTTAGTPPASAFPERSLFQTDAKALKLVMDDLDWGWRADASSCIAWVQSVSW